MQAAIITDRARTDQRIHDAVVSSAQRAALADAQHVEARLRMEDQRRAIEARQRAEQDKQRVRQLCYQNYGRPNC